MHEDLSSAEISTMEWQEKIEQARKYKASGNENYKGKQWKAAVGQYHRALLYIKGIEASQQPMFMDLPGKEQPKVPEEVSSEAKRLKIDCYNNLAACLLQQEQPNYSKIITYCDNVLEVSPQNVKAMYRKGVSLYYMKNYESAKSVLTAASNLPDGQKDGNIRKYLQLCDKGLESQDAKLKKTYQGMFQKMAEQPEDGT